MVHIHRPVSTAGEKHAGPASREADSVHGAFMALIGVEVLLVVGDTAAVQGAVLCAGDVRTWIRGVEIQR